MLKVCNRYAQHRKGFLGIFSQSVRSERDDKYNCMGEIYMYSEHLSFMHLLL